MSIREVVDDVRLEIDESLARLNHLLPPYVYIVIIDKFKVLLDRLRMHYVL